MSRFIGIKKMLRNAEQNFTSTPALFFDRLAYAAILSVLLFIPFTISGIEASSIVALIAGFTSMAIRRRWKLSELPLFPPLSFYLVAVVLSMGNTTFPEISLKGLFRVLKYLSLYLVVVQVVRTENRFRWLIWMLALVSFLSCLNALHQSLIGWDVRRRFAILSVEGVPRILGSFQHPNNFAAFLGTVILVLFFAKDGRFLRFCYFLICLFCIWALMKTHSRGPAILLGLVLCFSGLVCQRYRRYVLLILFFSIGTYILFAWRYPDFLHYFLLVGRRDARPYYWWVSLDLIKNHPIFGSGVNTFMNIFGANPKINHYGTTRFVYAHNFILQMWTEIGLFGLISFLVFLAQFFRRSFQYISIVSEPFKQIAYGFILAIIFFLTHALVDNNLQSLQLTTLFWVLVGSLMGLSRSILPAHPST